MPRGVEVGPRRPWVELDGYKFPLVENSALQVRPVTQFAPASQIGPTNRPPPDGRYLVETLADLTRGSGVKVINEIDGLNAYHTGTFDTRFRDGYGLPPVVETLPTTISLAGKGYTGNKLNQGGFTRAKVVRKDGGEALLYVLAEGGSLNDWYFAYNFSDDTIDAGTDIAFGGPVYWGSFIFAATLNGIKYTASGGGNTTWTNTAKTGNWRGLAIHDNKLWSYNTADQKLYASNDPTNSASWVAETVALPNIGHFGQLFEYKDTRGDPALVVLGENGAWGLDEDPDPAEWQRFIPASDWGYREGYNTLTQTVFPQATVWRKDQNAYFVFPGSPAPYGLHVVQWNGTARDTGPLQAGGFDIEERFEKILKVEGNTHFLYAFGVAGSTGLQDEVLAQNDTGGWHTLWVNPNTATDPIVAGAVDGGDVYVVLASGTIKAIRDRDTNVPPNIRYPSGGGHTQTSATLSSAWLRFGLPSHWKLMAYAYLSVVDRDGAPYLPDNNELQFSYRYDTSGWSTPVVVGDLTAFPALIPLPDSNQHGVGLRRLQVKLTASQTGTPEPFLVEELSIYAERWVQPFFAYQMVLDLSEETFGKDPQSTFQGRTLHELRRKLEQLAGVDAGTAYLPQAQPIPPSTPPPHFPANWAHGRWARSIAAAELQYGGTLDPGRGDGIFQVTVRDMSMPMPLPPLASPH